MSRKRKREPQPEENVPQTPAPAVIVRTPPKKPEPKRTISELSDRLSNMSMKQLRADCGSRGLKQNGNKAKLMRRLMNDETNSRKRGLDVQLSSGTKQIDSASHARKLVMSMFVSSATSGQEALRENLSINSGPENPFPWPTDKEDDVYVKIAGLWRHGAIEYSTNKKAMVRIPGVINTTGSFHWFPLECIVRRPPKLMFSLTEERKELPEVELNDDEEEEEVDIPAKVAAMSLNKLRQECLKRGLSKNGNGKKLRNRLQKALESEKQRQWISGTENLPNVFVRGEQIYDRNSGKFYHPEIGPSKACRLGLQLFQNKDYISASHLLRRYLLETPAASNKDFHGIACLTFIIALIRAYAVQIRHNIVCQEIDYAFGVASQWALAHEQDLKSSEELRRSYDKLRSEVLIFCPRLTKMRKQVIKRSDSYDIMERLFCIHKEQYVREISQWILKQKKELIIKAFECNRMEVKEQTGMPVQHDMQMRVNELLRRYIGNKYRRFLTRMVEYLEAFLYQMRRNRSEWVKRAQLRDIGLHEEVVPVGKVKDIFANLPLTQSNFLVIQCVFICGLYKLQGEFLKQEHSKKTAKPMGGSFRKRRATQPRAF